MKTSSIVSPLVSQVIIITIIAVSFLKLKQSPFHLFGIVNLAVYDKTLAFRILCKGIPEAICKYFTYDIGFLGSKEESMGENR